MIPAEWVNHEREETPVVVVQAWVPDQAGLRAFAAALGRPVAMLAIPEDPEPLGIDVDGWVAWHRAGLYQLGLAPPYRLIGYSLGGVFALELARVLTEAGVAVTSVLLIDTERPVPRPRGARRRVAHHLARLRSIPRARWPAYTRARLRSFRRMAPKHALLAVHRVTARLRGRPAPHWTDVFNIGPVARSARLAYLRYRARPYDGAVTLLTTDETVRRAFGDPALGWAASLPDLKVVNVPGGHWTLFDESHVASTSTAARAALDYGSTTIQPRR